MANSDDQAEATRRAPYADVHVVGLPRALMYYRLGTKWKTFLEALGREIVVSPESDRAILDRGQQLSVDECCLTSKLYLGHVDALVDKVDAIFVPSFYLSSPFKTYCTKFQALPDVVRNAFAIVDHPVRLLSPLLDEGATKDNAERNSYVNFAVDLGASIKEGTRAWKAATKAQQEHDAALAKAQAELVKQNSKLRKEDRPLTIVVAAHPYVAHDPLVGGVVTDALKAAGATVLYADECDHERAYKKSLEFSSFMPWVVNRELIGAILLLYEQVDGIVVMSSFPCGPDSMTNDAIARCIRGKPVLTLMLDAQSGTAGVETRIESFVDILSYQRKGGYLHE